MSPKVISGANISKHGFKGSTVKNQNQFLTRINELYSESASTSGSYSTSSSSEIDESGNSGTGSSI